MKMFSSHTSVVVITLAVLLVDHLADARWNPKVVYSHTVGKCGQLGVYKAPYADLHWCCNCAAGYSKSEDCRIGYPLSTNCTECLFDPENANNQTYTAETNNATECEHSFNESLCDTIRNSHWKAGSRTSPSTCQCNKGYYAHSDLLMKYGCNRHSPCEEGFEPVIQGSETTDTLCQPCQQGMFSDISSPTEKCKPHSKCRSNETEETPGNATSDVRCSIIVPKAVKERGYLWIIPVLVVVLLIFVPVAIYFYKNGCCCKTEFEGPIKGGTDSSLHLTKELIESDLPTDGSHCPLIDDSIESLPDSKETDKEVFSETDQQIPLQQENMQSSPPCKLVTEIEMKEMKPTAIIDDFIDDILEYCRSLDDNNKNKLLLTYTGWKDMVRKLYRDPEIGKIIIRAWENVINDSLRPVIRMFLENIAVDDIERDYHHSRKEIRYRWLEAICTTHGNLLTPECLFMKNYGEKTFKDSLLSAFVSSVIEKLDGQESYNAV